MHHDTLGTVERVLTEGREGARSRVARDRVSRALTELVMRDVEADEPEKLTGETKPGKGKLVGDSKSKASTGPRRTPKYSNPLGGEPSRTIGGRRRRRTSPGRTRGNPSTPKKPSAGRSGTRNKQELPGLKGESYGLSDAEMRRMLAIDYGYDRRSLARMSRSELEAALDFADEVDAIESVTAESVSEAVTLPNVQYHAAEVTRKIGEAYNAAVAFKGLIDQMEHIPPSLRRSYDRSLKVMSALGQAKDGAYQSQMELRRLRP